jgi:hypothetical protein
VPEPTDRVSAIPRDESEFFICDGGPPAFRASDLDGPTGAEQEDHPAAEALRKRAADPGGVEQVPATGWRILHRSDREVLYASEDEEYADPEGDEPPERHLVRVVREPDGTWRWATSSHYVESFDAIRDGNPASDWRLDPAADPPGPSDTELRVLVTECHCASGRTAEGRIEPPDVYYTADEVRIVAYVTRLRGTQRCPGNPPTPAIFVLPEPIGERRLVDAGTFPPD